MIDHNTEKLLFKFLNHSSGGNIVNILGYNYRAVVETLSSNTFEVSPTQKLNTILTIKCHCKDNLHFNGMDNLHKRTYLIFKDILTDFNGIEIEYNYSMYCCRD